MLEAKSRRDSLHIVVLVFVLCSSVATSCLIESRRHIVRKALPDRSVRFSGVITEAIPRKSAVIKGAIGSLFRVDLSEINAPLHPGDRVVINGRFSAPKQRRNPYDFDERAFFQSKNWFGSIESITSLVIDHRRHERSLSYAFYRIRRTFLGLIQKRFESPESQHLITALFLGDRSGITLSIQSDFQRTGLGHLLAISGLHVGIIAGLIRFLIRVMALRLPIRSALRTRLIACLSLLGIWVFAGLVGMSASVVRASIMLSIFIIPDFSDRRLGSGHPLWSVGIACFLILLIRPRDIFAPGFQLSFSAVVFILLVMGRPSTKSGINSFGKAAYSSVSVTCAASVGTAPILAYYFGFVPVGALIFSPIAVLLLTIILPIALLAVFLPGGYPAFSTVAEGLLILLVRFSEVGSNITWIPSWVGPTYTFPVLVWLPTIGFLLWIYGKQTVPRMLILGLMAALSIHACFTPKKGPTLTFLEVGQGDAIVLEGNNKGALVVDLGPGPSSGRTVFNHLKARALTGSYSVLLSHGHQDHIGGFPVLLKQARLTPILKTDELPRFVYHGGWINAKDAQITPILRGQTIHLDESLRIYVLNPLFPGGENNDSIVLLVQYGQSRVLLMGDVEDEAEIQILKRFGSFLGADLLKIGHHGSKTSTSNALLRTVKPTMSVISAGAKNKFGHPHAEVLNRLENHQIDVLETSKEGAIIIRMDGIQMKRLDWK